MTAIIDFYEDGGPDGSGRTLEDVLNKPFHWLESCHDYIQWLFPLREPSNFNPEAPLLTDEDVVYLRHALHHHAPISYHFADAVIKFTAFLGISCVGTDSFELTDDFEKQKYTWLEFNHNALRITRFLSCLAIVGWGQYAASLLAFMKQTAWEQDVQLSANVLMYWENALNER